MPASTTAALEVLSDETVQVERWRLQQFVRLGFDLVQAATLTVSDVELATARKLIAAGCPPPTAYAILA